MTLNLSGAKNHGCRPYPRGSVRRTSGFVLTGNTETIRCRPESRRTRRLRVYTQRERIPRVFKPGVICFVSAILLGLSASAQSTRPDAEKQVAHDIYKQFVEIQSGFTTGSTTPVAEAAASRLRAAGLANSDIFIGGAIPKKANLVARYHGTGAGKPILLLAHTDVVEAKREDWTTDPFTFVERDGYFYGRGTQDMKANDAILVTTFIRLQREQYRPVRNVILALTADEEGGQSMAWNGC